MIDNLYLVLGLVGVDLIVSLLVCCLLLAGLLRGFDILSYIPGESCSELRAFLFAVILTACLDRVQLDMLVHCLNLFFVDGLIVRAV